MVGIVEHRKNRPADDIGAVLARDPDHFGEPVPIGIFVVVEHGHIFGRRRRAAGIREGAVIGVGLAAARLDDAGERQAERSRHLLDNRRAGTAFGIIVDDDDVERAGVIQSLDMGEQLAQPIGTAERRHAQTDMRRRRLGHGAETLRVIGPLSVRPVRVSNRKIACGLVMR